MKLHYFNQAQADPDDVARNDAVAEHIVPATCLVGGRIIAAARKVGESPCDNCNGPRARCSGTPLMTVGDTSNKQVRSAIRSLLTGKPENKLF